MSVVLLGAPGIRAEDMKGMNMSTKPAATTAADKAFAASTKTMMKGMNVKPTGNPDKDFVLMMMPHHQGAIDMAKAELAYGKDPVMKRLAEEIMVDQQSEIQAMQLWLSKQPTTTPEGRK